MTVHFVKEESQMSGENPSNFRARAAISVSQMAKLIGLSRSAFYGHVRSNVFPQPLYSLHNRRPFYDATMQQQIVTTRNTGLTPDGRFVIFYDRRNEPSEKSAAKKIGRPAWVERLKELGLSVSESKVNEALTTLFPHGIAGADEAEVLRTLYRHLRRAMS